MIEFTNLQTLEETIRMKLTVMNREKGRWRHIHHGKESSKEGMNPRIMNPCNLTNRIFPKRICEINARQSP
jgi:hypothetical protein